MQLKSFRITNFRSIIDSGWVPFSPDGITVFVGQNESGKSSILDALYFALSTELPAPDDFRVGCDLPAVVLKLVVMPEEIDQRFSKVKPTAVMALKQYLSENLNEVDLECGWTQETGTAIIDDYCQTTDPALDRLIESSEQSVGSAAGESQGASAILLGEDAPRGDAISSSTASPAGVSATPSASAAVIPATAAAPAAGGEATTEIEDISTALWSALPLGVLFNEESGRLHGQVEIDAKGQPTGEGARAARNFLRIAEVNLPELLKGDRRFRENTLNRANARVSHDFNSFWSQTIGKSGRLTLKCDIDYYPNTAAENAGKAHLVFWICDGNTQLYPHQRSRGVRWFVSFYLQLKASEKAKNRRVFLLDEPGANLHSKAQGDVLSLINKLGKDTSTVVYSTHSPQMLEYSKLFRIHAVQRDSELDDSPTQIIDAHRLGSASTDTLSPILTAMGADLSQHQVVKKSNNVLLEEVSGYYYILAFWQLLGIKTEANFIASTGVNKLEILANMFRGWGLRFVVAVDDDRQGREVFNSLKRDFFGDDFELASKFMLKFPGLPAIEDVFDPKDFAKYVLGDESIELKQSNADYIKEFKRSKPVLAFNFALAVDERSLKIDMLSQTTKDNIGKITDGLIARLKNLHA